MMVRLIDTLENHGLVSTEAVEKLVFELPFKKVVKIQEDIETALLDSNCTEDSDRELSSFDFLASASFRGDSGCGSWQCHTKRAQLLARYAACFCDRVVVPLNITANHKNASQRDQRFALGRGLLEVVEMRPVIDAGVVIPVASSFHYCPYCFPERVPAVERVLEVNRQLIEHLFDKLSITYEPRSPRRPKGRLTVYGPEEYIEHGECRYPAQGTDGWLPRAPRGARVRLNEDQKRKSGLIQQLITQIAIDVSAQQVYSTRFNVSYLTNRPGEAQFLELLQSDDQLAARTAPLCAQFTHSIPLFTELPLDRVMSIRREDRTAFESYRAALGKIVKDHIAANKEFSVSEARDLYTDILEPEILNLEQQAKNERKRATKESALNTGITACVVALGAYSGLLPAHLTELCAAIGGVKLVADLAKSVAAIQMNPTKVRNSNLYFLLRLKQEGQ